MTGWRTIYSCPDCGADLEEDGHALWCPDCERTVPYALLATDGDDHDRRD